MPKSANTPSLFFFFFFFFFFSYLAYGRSLKRGIHYAFNHDADRGTHNRRQAELTCLSQHASKSQNPSTETLLQM
jgi:hypothetical protein